MTPSKLLKGRSRYEVLFNCKPSYNKIRVFGTLRFEQNNPRMKDKFVSRSRRCAFLNRWYVTQRHKKFFSVRM